MTSRDPKGHSRDSDKFQAVIYRQKIAWQQGNYYTKDPDAETEMVWSRVTNRCQQTTLASPIDEGEWILKQRKTKKRWIDCSRDVTQ